MHWWLDDRRFLRQDRNAFDLNMVDGANPPGLRLRDLRIPHRIGRNVSGLLLRWLLLGNARPCRLPLGPSDSLTLPHAAVAGRVFLSGCIADHQASEGNRETEGKAKVTHWLHQWKAGMVMS